MRLHAVKRAAARALDLVGLNGAGLALQRATLHPFIRAVNYHAVPAHLGEAFEAHLRWYAARFADVTRPALLEFLASGRWPHARPGLLLSFDDGERSHYEEVAPRLERHGFTGWFFVPIGLLRGAAELGAAPAPADPERLTLAQLRALDARHVVGCHTETHRRFTRDVPLAELRRETLGARALLERALGHPVDAFCWVGGEEPTYNAQAAALIREGYALGFMTNTAVIRPGTSPWQLQRTNVEAHDPLWLVRFQISGLMDLLYAGKRARVNRLTAP